MVCELPLLHLSILTNFALVPAYKRESVLLGLLRYWNAAARLRFAAKY